MYGERQVAGNRVIRRIKQFYLFLCQGRPDPSSLVSNEGNSEHNVGYDNESGLHFGVCFGK
jgi:hypothetical protein